jgi:hypothetical protein
MRIHDAHSLIIIIIIILPRAVVIFYTLARFSPAHLCTPAFI